jgi:polyhydroxyalkanoate synthase
VAPPGEPGHTYRIKTEVAHATYTGPDEWLKTVPPLEGSWWPEWTKWLSTRSGEPSEPPRMGAEADEGTNLADAPGDYVRH